MNVIQHVLAGASKMPTAPDKRGDLSVSANDYSLTHPVNCRYKGGNQEGVVMMFFMILSLWSLILCPSREAWAQKSLPTVRIGIEAVAGTNSHYYVTK
jgi:hypothetical protein